MQNEKTHENPPPISGGYGRRLKKEESAKGFTLVELIVVIVILAILAAILIPGLLKWIDQAKDKKYELEAREIALAAEAALTKVYAEGSEEVVMVADGTMYQNNGISPWDWPNLMNVDIFKDELEKLTGYTREKVKAVYIYGKGYDAASVSGTQYWDGSVCGFEIWFESSDEVDIHAYYYMSGPYDTPTNGWEITKNVSWEGWDGID